MEKHLHIVSFNVPYPADYGGVIDVYYRLQALWRAGVKIHLHCYTYGRPEAPQLERFCEEVRYYRRETLPSKLFTRLPYIVSSRCNSQLLADLQADAWPVLLEGLHCCYLLSQLRQAQPQRLLLVRAHNVEHRYYSLLAKSEHRMLRRLYLLSDALKLQAYEPVLRQASHILAISDGDASYFRQQGYAPVSLVTAGHGEQSVSAPLGKGKYALFQGDLSVSDNQRAVEYLLNQVLTPVSGTPQFPLVVAGKNPPKKLSQLIDKHNRKLASCCGCSYKKSRQGLSAVPNTNHAVRLVANPDDAEMHRLLYDAHVCILFTGQATGIKLKLLHALYESRFCLVNSLMVQGTTLAPLCMVADTPQDTRQLLAALFNTPFTDTFRCQREVLLTKEYSDDTGAQTVLQLMEEQAAKPSGDR